MLNWVFGCDESGTFEPNERVMFLVGGVLLPDPDVAEDLAATLRESCDGARVRFPPHATELRRSHPEALDSLLRDTAAWLAQNECWFVGVISKARTQTADPALHARMLGAVVELAGRVAAAHGIEALTLHPASRGFLLDEADVDAYRKAGVYTEQRDDHWHLRGVTGGEVREALDSLRRAAPGVLPAFPRVDQVTVKSAAASAVHPTVLAADLLCNHLYVSVARNPQITLERLGAASEWWGKRMLVVDYHTFPAVRAVDAALRRDPPSLLAFSESLEGIRSRRALADSRSDELVLGTEGALELAQLFWQQAEPRMVAACERQPRLSWAVAQRLAGDAGAELDMKHGAYAATRLALSLGFHGDAPLAQTNRRVQDSELRARLWRMTLEACNHTGDTAGGRAAYREFTQVFRRGGSLSMLAEALTVENLANVLEQNELPLDASETFDQLELLKQRAADLLALARATDERLGVFMSSESQHSAAPDERELRLRELMAYRGPTWKRPDRHQGRAYGTAARSLAFCGDLETALSIALDARLCFEDSPFDLRMNACVMARIRLEQARLGLVAEPDELVQLLLDLSGATPLGDPKVAVSSMLADPTQRFAFDILLRRLSWHAPGDAGTRYRSLLDDLRSGEGSTLYRLLRELRSHPTELIARHCGELLRRHGFDSRTYNLWFDLSLTLSEAEPGTTLARMGLYTRRLRDRAASEGGAANEGGAGSILNPTFEYR
ncbi:MAG TPA: hypothetical protein VFU02_14000 [Polyangiaceae bacterium]|nr:hypothetical protein [Polyangiaceae bacterium]